MCLKYRNIWSLTLCNMSTAARGNTKCFCLAGHNISEGTFSPFSHRTCHWKLLDNRRYLRWLWLPPRPPLLPGPPALTQAQFAKRTILAFFTSLLDRGNDRTLPFVILQRTVCNYFHILRSRGRDIFVFFSLQPPLHSSIKYHRLHSKHLQWDTFRSQCLQRIKKFILLTNRIKVRWEKGTC